MFQIRINFLPISIKSPEKLEKIRSQAGTGDAWSCQKQKKSKHELIQVYGPSASADANWDYCSCSRQNLSEYQNVRQNKHGIKNLLILKNPGEP